MNFFLAAAVVPCLTGVGTLAWFSQRVSRLAAEDERRRAYRRAVEAEHRL